MKKEEYLNIISDEIKKNEILLNDTNNSIVFYEKMNDTEKVNEFLKNKKLYETRIKYLKGIENLPLYLKINNITSKEITQYKDKLINDISIKYNELNNKLKELDSYVDEINKQINSKYELYKETNDEKYVEESKYLLNCIKTYRNEIELIKEQLINFGLEKAEVLNLNRDKLISKLFDENNLSNMDNQLNLYIPDKIDRLVVPMCSELNTLDEIISLMEDYIKIDKEKIYETIDLPSILNDYTFDDSYECSLNSFADLIKAHLDGTKLEMYDIEDFDLLLEHIEYGNDKLNKDEVKLENYNRILELFPSNSEKYQLSSLKHLVNEIFKNGEYNSYIKDEINKSLEEINEMERTIESLSYKFQTEKVTFKIKYLAKEIEEKTKKIINYLWDYITNELRKTLEVTKHNYKFYSDIEYLHVDQTNDEIIIETDKYSNLSLYNTKVLIYKTLEKYRTIISELENLKEEISEDKVDFIRKESTKNNELYTINQNIKSLYSRVSDATIEELDYNKIINVFKNNTIIDSIVKVEREDLIKKIKNSTNDINILDIIDMSNEKEEKVELEENITHVEEQIEEPEEKNIETEVVVEEPVEKKQEKQPVSVTSSDKKKEKLDMSKIKQYIEKLGLDSNTLKEMLKKILCDESIINILFNIDTKDKLDKPKVKDVLNNINVDDYNSIYELISDLNDKLDLNNEDLTYLGSELLKNKGLLINILKSNKKLLFNLLKSDVLKKILKK